MYVSEECFQFITDDDVKRVLKRVGIDGEVFADHPVSYGYVMGGGHTLESGGVFWIIYLECKHQDESRITALQKALKDVRVVVEFESIYGEKGIEDTR